MSIRFLRSKEVNNLCMGYWDLFVDFSNVKVFIVEILGFLCVDFVIINELVNELIK